MLWELIQLQLRMLKMIYCQIAKKNDFLTLPWVTWVYNEHMEGV